MTYLPEDIVVDIVQRLPVKPLFRCKCLSKRYASIISDPKFAQTYLKRAYSSPESWANSGLFTGLLFPFTGLSPEQKSIKDLRESLNDFDSNDIYLSFHSSLPKDDGIHKLVGSNSGLVLSLSNPDTWFMISRLFISNPLTKQWVQLPKWISVKPRYSSDLEYALATRLDQGDASLVTYKVVIIEQVPDSVPSGTSTDSTVEIFSSDTGSWCARKLNCPDRVINRCALKSLFSYKGTLHWLDVSTRSIVTYDPFDSPDQFGRIQLPNDPNPDIGFKYSSLIYSGDHEMLKYCEIEENTVVGSEIDTLLVWRYDKGEWCVEPNCVYTSSKPRLHWSWLMVAPYPWKRHLICFLHIINSSFAVIDTRARKLRISKVDLKTEPVEIKRHFRNRHPLSNLNLHTELCPWSSPFYYQSSN